MNVKSRHNLTLSSRSEIGFRRQSVYRRTENWFARKHEVSCVVCANSISIHPGRFLIYFVVVPDDLIDRVVTQPMKGTSMLCLDKAKLRNRILIFGALTIIAALAIVFDAGAGCPGKDSDPYYSNENCKSCNILTDGCYSYICANEKCTSSGGSSQTCELCDKEMDCPRMVCDFHPASLEGEFIPVTPYATLDYDGVVAKLTGTCP